MRGPTHQPPSLMILFFSPSSGTEVCEVHDAVVHVHGADVHVHGADVHGRQEVLV